MNPQTHNFQDIELAQMLHFKALPIEEKLQAVEDMCEMSNYLLQKAAERKQKALKDSQR